ncbi:DUF5106 domain-containing protein [Gracilimonas sp. Q87]|uniref:DUF5106 domain-containing protein n=1 Tax=Gracilimonas sp. Q87 TaxID=3384766 RepID=UPI0039841408
MYAIRLIPLLFLIILQTGCTNSAEKQGYHINLVLNGEAPQEVYLGYQLSDKTYIADTARNQQGEFEFSGNETLDPGLYMMIIPPENSFVNLIVDENDQHFELTAHTNHLLDSLSFEGTPANTAFRDYNQMIENKNMEMSGLMALEEEAENVEAERLRNRQDQIKDEVFQTKQQLIQEYPDHFLSSFMASTLQPVIPEPEPGMSEAEAREFQFRYYKEHYFDHFDLSEPGLIRTAGYHQTIDGYLDRLVTPQKDSLLKEVNMLINAAAANPKTKQAMTVHLLNKYASDDSYEAESVYTHIALTYYADTAFTDWVDEEQRVRILENARRLDSALVMYE